MTDFAQARATMVASQIRPADVTSRPLQNALLAVPREQFLPADQQAKAYADDETAVTPGRVMARPRDFAKLVQAANIRAGDRVLDIACGHGYSTAILARLAAEVVALESDEALVEAATTALAGIANASVVKGDLKAGLPGKAPFDVIFVNGAIDAPPQSWLDQLAEGGRLAAVVRDGAVGQASIFTKTGDGAGRRAVFEAHIPLLPGFETEAGFVF